MNDMSKDNASIPTNKFFASSGMKFSDIVNKENICTINFQK